MPHLPMLLCLLLATPPASAAAAAPDDIGATFASGTSDSVGGSGIMLPGAVLQAALQAAADSGVETFTVPPGEYNFSASPLRLANATGLDIVGAGAVTLWFAPGGGLVLVGCTDVSIRGLALDWSPTLAQGVVLAVYPGGAGPEAAASFTARFDPTFLAPCPSAATKPCKVGLYDPKTRFLVRDGAAPAAVNIYTPKVELVGGQTYRVFVHGDGGHGLGLAAVGQLVTVFHGSNPHSYTAINCSRITLEDFSIYGGTGMGLVDGQGGGGSTYRRVTLTRRPLQRGVGMVALPQPYTVARLQATNEDGFHSSGNSKGPLIVDSRIEFTGDDNGNICSAMSVVLGQFGPDMACLSALAGAACSARPAGAPRAEILGCDACRVTAGLSAGCSHDEIRHWCTQHGAQGGAALTSTNVVTMVDVSRNLLRGRAGDVLSFYHLKTMAFQGSVTLAGTPVVSHNEAAIAKMRTGYTTMQAPPYSAHFVPLIKGVFGNGFPVAVPTTGPPPPNATAFWSIGVLRSTDNSGARVINSTFSDSYARAFMIKGRDAVYSGNTFRRSGGLHIGPEQAWLEGDPGIENVTVVGNLFDQIGSPPVEIIEGVPPGRGITVKDNRVAQSGAMSLKTDDRFNDDQAALSPPDSHFWRNDSANLAITEKWNKYLDALRSAGT